MLRGTCTRYRGRMFIRRTQTRRTEDGQPYFSHRLVHSERIGKRRPPAHPAQSRTPLRHSPSAMAAALLPHRRHPDRPDAVGRRLPDRRRTRSPTDSRTVDRPRHTRAGTGRRAARRAAGRRRLAAPGPPPQRRRRAGRPVGPGAIGPADPAGRVGRQRRVAHRGGRRRRRASGPAGLGARDAPLAANAQRPRRVARRRLRDRQLDAALPLPRTRW